MYHSRHRNRSAILVVAPGFNSYFVYIFCIVLIIAMTATLFHDTINNVIVDRKPFSAQGSPSILGTIITVEKSE